MLPRIRARIDTTGSWGSDGQNITIPEIPGTAHVFKMSHDIDIPPVSGMLP